MKALTVKQPWAWAICRGIKPVENRSWPTAYRGPVLIHAGKRRENIAELPDGTPIPEHLDLGAIIGYGIIKDCVPVESVSNVFATGPWCWIISSPIIFPEPIFCRGQLGLWNPVSSVLQSLSPQLRPHIQM